MWCVFNIVLWMNIVYCTRMLTITAIILPCDLQLVQNWFQNAVYPTGITLGGEDCEKNHVLTQFSVPPTTSRDLFSSSQGLFGVGTWCVGRQRAGAPLLAAEVALRSRVGKYIARSDAHVLMRFEVIFQDSRQHSRADR